jgi:hypothetical protein
MDIVEALPSYTAEELTRALVLLTNEVCPNKRITIKVQTNAREEHK